MTDLTDGYHYAIVFDKERIIEKKKDLPIPYCEGFCCQNYQYLAPVPTYDEWQRILHYAGKYEVEYTSCVMDYENLKEENTKLKELLKECREPLEVLAERRNACDWYPEDLLAKINQALGEDK